MRGWKRDRPHLSSPLSKRHRRRTPNEPEFVDSPADDAGADKQTRQSSVVVVSGLTSECTVLSLKSRFEMFGPISRLRIDPSSGLGYLTFRSHDSALAAVSAALDPSSPIIVASQQVGVSWANDPLPLWRAGVKSTSVKDKHGLSSKLLRAEIPLSRYGRGNKKIGPETVPTLTKTKLELPFEGREIVAYDDLL